ncbi:heme exporter protein CcmD [Simiduia curdlanivorans]|uniref:Heme exporter protein D n=1 Tax=Simiduia curdlanivorans TaxID=1492769 RepID=A0ABV8V8R3_9GAMM|nr:heme exporter protein CcmD [Simiduia curdlanivorans]MDN3639369.1 heme exporter protein CcmD [Simiduia curdlanivorans]
MTFQFDSLHSFIAMGTHGPFVWSVVVITLLVLAWLVLWPLKLHRDALAEQARLARIEKARQDHAAATSSQ